MRPPPPSQPHPARPRLAPRPRRQHHRRAQLLHLAAETYYQFNTFAGQPWPTTSPETRQRFGPAMKLGDLGRRLIQNHDLPFYLDTLAEVRAHTLAQLRTRDDAWLLAIDETWPWGPTNNFCKWFHVCEHESHHLGQIGLHLKSIRARNSILPVS